jgi:hypothetical protein
MIRKTFHYVCGLRWYGTEKRKLLPGRAAAPWTPSRTATLARRFTCHYHIHRQTSPGVTTPTVYET